MTEPAHRLDSSRPAGARRRRGGELLDHRQGIGPGRGAPRLHRGPDRPRDPAARGADGARGGARERLRRGRHLLGVAPRARRGGGGGAHRVAADRRSTRWRWGSASARPRWSRAASARRIRRARRARRCRRSCSRSSCRSVLGTAGALLAPRLLALMGATPAVIATGRGYATIMLGGEAAIIVLFVVNADLPRRGRRGDRDAGALAREHHQHRAGSAAHLRRGPVSQARRHRRGDRDDDRPLDRRDSTPWCACSAMRAGCRSRRRHLRLDFGVMRQILDLSGSAHAAEPDRHGELDRAGADPRRLRQRRARRLHHRGAAHHLRAAAVVGAEQRGGDDGGPEPRRPEARPGRGIGLAGRAVQRGASSRRWASSSSPRRRSSSGPSPRTRR